MFVMTGKMSNAMTSKRQDLGEYRSNRHVLEEASGTGTFDSPRKILAMPHHEHYLTEKLQQGLKTCSSNPNTISEGSPGTSSASVSPHVDGDEPPSPEPELGNIDPRLNSMDQNAAMAGCWSEVSPMSSLHQKSNLGPLFLSGLEVAKICKRVYGKDSDSICRLVEELWSQSQSVSSPNDQNRPPSNDRLANLSNDLQNTRQYLAQHPDMLAGFANHPASASGGRENHGFPSHSPHSAASYCGHSGSVVDNHARSASLAAAIPRNEAWNDPTGLYFSIRQHGHDFRLLRSPARALFYSSRLPEMAYIPFYASWTPQVMRFVQEKFGMSLQLLKWIQDILEAAKVPMKRELKVVHFDDPTVRGRLNPVLLKELLGKILKQNPPRAINFAVEEYQMNDEQRVPVDSLPKLADMQVVKHLDTPPPSPVLTDVLGIASEEVVQSDVVSSQVSAQSTIETSSLEADSMSSQQLLPAEVVAGLPSETDLSIDKTVIENDGSTAAHSQSQRSGANVSKMPINLSEDCSANVTPSDAGALVATCVETSEFEKSTSFSNFSKTKSKTQESANQVTNHTDMENVNVYQSDFNQLTAKGIPHPSGLGVCEISDPVDSDGTQSLAPLVGVQNFGTDSNSPEMILSIPQENVLANEHQHVHDQSINSDSALVGIDSQNSDSEKHRMRTGVEDDDLPINDTNVEPSELDKSTEVTNHTAINNAKVHQPDLNQSAAKGIHHSSGLGTCAISAPVGSNGAQCLHTNVEENCLDKETTDDHSSNVKLTEATSNSVTSVNKVLDHTGFAIISPKRSQALKRSANIRNMIKRKCWIARKRVSKARSRPTVCYQKSALTSDGGFVSTDKKSSKPLIAPESKDDNQNASCPNNINSVNVPPIKSIDSAVVVESCPRSKKDEIGNARVSSTHSGTTSGKVGLASCQVQSKENSGTDPKPQPNSTNRQVSTTKPEKTDLDFGSQGHFETVANAVPSPQRPKNDSENATNSRSKTSKEGSNASISSSTSVGRVWNGPGLPVVDDFKTESTNIGAHTCPAPETVVLGHPDSGASGMVGSCALAEDHNFSSSRPMPYIWQILAAQAPGDHQCHLLESPNSTVKKTLELLQAAQSASVGETASEEDLAVLEEFVSESDPASARSPSSSPEIIGLKIEKSPGKADLPKAKSHAGIIVDKSVKTSRHLDEVSDSAMQHVYSTATLTSDKTNGEKIELCSGRPNQDGSKPPSSRPNKLKSRASTSGARASNDPKSTATPPGPSSARNLLHRADLANSANASIAKKRMNEPVDSSVLAGGGKPIPVLIAGSSKPKKSRSIFDQRSQNIGTGSPVTLVVPGTGISDKRGKSKNVKNSQIESSKVLSQIHVNPKLPAKPKIEPAQFLPATSPDLRASEDHQNPTDDKFMHPDHCIDSIESKSNWVQRAIDILQTFMQKAVTMVKDRNDWVFIRQKYTGLSVSDAPGDGFIDRFFQRFADGSERLQCLRPVFAAMAAEYLGCRGKSIYDVIACLVAMQHDAPMVVWLNDVFPRTVLCHGKSTAEALRQIDQRHLWFVPYLAMISNDTGVPVDRITAFLETETFGLVSPKLRSGSGNPRIDQETLSGDLAGATSPPRVTSEDIAEQNSYLLTAARVKSWSEVMGKEFNFFNKRMITVHACVLVYAARFEPEILTKMVANIEKRDFSNFFQYWFNALDSWIQFIRTSEEHLEDFKIYFQYFDRIFVEMGWFDQRRYNKSTGQLFYFDFKYTASRSENAATLLLRKLNDPCDFALTLYAHNQWAYREMRRFLMNRLPDVHTPEFSLLDSRFREVFVKTEQQFLEWLLTTGTGKAVFAAWVTNEVAPVKNGFLSGCPVTGRNFWTNAKLTKAALTFCQHGGMDTIKNLIRVLRSGSRPTWTSGVGGEFVKGLFFACFKGEKCEDVQKIAAKMLEQVQCQKKNNTRKNTLFAFLRSVPGHIKPLDALVRLEHERSAVLLALDALMQMSSKTLQLYAFVVRDIANSFNDVVRKLENKVVGNSGIAVDKSVDKRPDPCPEDSLGPKSTPHAQKPPVCQSRTISPDFSITLSNSGPRVSVSDAGFRGSYGYVKSGSSHSQSVVDLDRTFVATGSPLVVPDAPTGFKRALVDKEPPVGSAPPKRSKFSDGPRFGIRRTISGSNHQESDYKVEGRDSVSAPATDNHDNGGTPFSGNPYLNKETGCHFDPGRSHHQHNMPVSSLPSITVNQRVGREKIQGPVDQFDRPAWVSSGGSSPQDFSSPSTKGPVFGRLGESRDQYPGFNPPNRNINTGRVSDMFLHRRSRLEEVDRERMDLAPADLPPLSRAQERPAGTHVTLDQYRSPEMSENVPMDRHSGPRKMEF